MEWTKIKPQHWIASPLSMSSRGCLVTLLCLTAMLERIPIEGEMLKVCNLNVLETLRKSLRNQEEILSEILEKVLQDLDKLNHKKAVSRETSKRYDEQKKGQKKLSDTSSDTTEKRREEKRREDIKKVTESDFEEIWKKYKNKDGKKDALKHFIATVKTTKDLENINKAIDNYNKCKKVKAGYIKNGSTWFNNWQDWVDFEEFETEEDKVEKRKKFMDNLINGEPDET